ncbi:hypothetical protein ABW20_dc0107970 [Dactylellina cionopaga]|nr:hypothetical protein ABW20_dc0107970 [Dactylellina cionopaga]
MDHQSSLFLLDDDSESSAPTFKFYNRDTLSTDNQLVVQKSRTPDGHTQEWGKFELIDKSSFARDVKLHWKTKYLAPTSSMRNPTAGQKARSRAAVPNFMLDMVYCSKDRNYRFAVRIHRAKISNFLDGKEGPFLLLHILKASEWDPPKAGDYDKHPERPSIWLEIPVTIKLYAKKIEDFNKLKLETIALCDSQSIITWNTILGNRYAKRIIIQDEPEANLRKRPDMLNKLTNRLHGEELPLAHDPDNPFTLKTTFLPKPASHSVIYERGYGLENDQFDTARLRPSEESKQSDIQDGSCHYRSGNPFTIEYSSKIPQTAISNTPTPEKYSTLDEFHDLPFGSSEKLKKGPRTPNTRKRAASSPSLSPKSQPVAKKAKGVSSLEVESSKDEQKRKENSSKSLFKPEKHTTSLQPSKAATQASTKDKSQKSLNQVAADVATDYVHVERETGRCEPQPGYIFIGEGRNLEEEFGQKLNPSQAILIQWMEEFDKRHGIVRPTEKTGLEKVTRTGDVEFDIIGVLGSVDVSMNDNNARSGYYSNDENVKSTEYPRT